MPGELVTIQLGGYANYVGSHYWNIQDELLGYSGKEEWQDLAAVIDPGMLFSITEDRAVRAHTGGALPPALPARPLCRRLPYEKCRHALGWGRYAPPSIPLPVHPTGLCEHY